MKKEKCLGIFMNHENAHLIDQYASPDKQINIASKFNHLEKLKTLSLKGEGPMHNKEQHFQADFYKQLGEVIRNYDSVLLFGPTEAKTELFNILQANHLFDKITISVESTDKLTHNQQHSFVSEFFNK